MTFAHFAQTLVAIEKTTLRNQITTELAALFAQLQDSEIEPACWLLLGRIVPPYEGLEFQFADKMFVRVLAELSNQSIDSVKLEFQKWGDMGSTAVALLHFEQEDTTTLTQVHALLLALAREQGSGSQERKLSLVRQLLKERDSTTAKYFTRILLGTLRLGFSDMTILDALSWARHGNKQDRKTIETAYQYKADIGAIAHTYLTRGLEGLRTIEVTVGIPLQPALCQRLKTAQEMIEKMGRVYVEPKYDGTRVQIHVASHGPWKIRTFTRSLEESSEMFPELHEYSHVFAGHSVILDSEAIGVDASGNFLPFQETIQRKRKHDTAAMAQKIPLKFFVFDILYLDGRSLVDEPLRVRKTILQEFLTSLVQADNAAAVLLLQSPFIETESADALRTYHTQQLQAGLEGVVIKQVESPYSPGRKGYAWVKFKEDETAAGKLSDTIDAVVMGYWYGKGKRHQFGIGAFLIGITDSNGMIVTVSKVGTGLSDEQFGELARRCGPLRSVAQPFQYSVNKFVAPDVWVQPAIVVEVAGDELTISSQHTAEVALRFPRLVRFRDDKRVEDITTKEEVLAIQRASQTVFKNLQEP